MPLSRPRVAAAAAVGLSLALTGVAFVSADADPAGTGLVISEAYGGGGNSGSTLKNDFIGLYNPTGADVSVSGMSVQYRSSSAAQTVTSSVTNLTGVVPAKGHYLVQEAAGNSGTVDLPSPDASGDIAMSGSAFTVFLAKGTAPITPPLGSVTNAASIVDLVGVNSNTFETAKAAGVGNATSSSRSAAGADTDDNAADFTTGAPTPTSSGSTGGGTGTATPTPTGTATATPTGTATAAPPQTVTIAQIQGDDTDTSPYAGKAVTTTGVVTASYPVGGLAGFDIQTGGLDTTPNASDGIFVYGGSQLPADAYPAIGSTVTVTGTATEFFGLTEINVDGASSVVAANQPQAAVVPKTVVPGTDCALPGDACLTGDALDAAAEKHESELYQPTATYTVTDAYDGSPAPSTSGSFLGEIGLAANSDQQLIQPTELYDAQNEKSQIATRMNYNTAHRVILDDGSSTNYSRASGEPFPYFTKDHYVRDGAKVTFPKPVVLSYGFGSFKLEPQSQVVGDSTGVVNFSQNRPTAPGNVGGDIRLGTFNVLNYFPTTGEEYAAQPGNTCTYYDDRDGNHITDRNCTGPNGSSGPRGAANDANLQRQQAKIVAAINRLGASIVSLEEIENSVEFGKNRDFALSTLVGALNADTGANTWAFAPSPAADQLPPTAQQDVIRTAFIYQPADVTLVGPSKVLIDSPAFSNAREPLAQGFKSKGAPNSSAFSVIVNHFKSKGSGTDDGTGQGNANPDRVNQAKALEPFAQGFSDSLKGSGAIFLTGDFNAYTMEDPIQELTGNGGYDELESTTDPNEESYNFAGLSGSLDHVLANPAAQKLVTGVDVWNINADESVYYEYSRFNYNVTDLYSPGPYRASDHNPEIVGLDLTPSTPTPTPTAPLNTTIVVGQHPKRVKAGKTRPVLVVKVNSSSDQPVRGLVKIAVPGKGVYKLTLQNGKAKFHLPVFKVANTRTIKVVYAGNDMFQRRYVGYTFRVVNR